MGTTPPFNLNWIPGYQQGNVARGMLDQQHYPKSGGNRHRPKAYAPGYAYILPPYGYYGATLPVYYEPTPPAQPAPVVPRAEEPPPAPLGALRLEVEPRELLQIFVDGVFIGTPVDLGEFIELTPGVRRIELRAPGHRTLVFDADIVADRAITYRGVLDRSNEPGAPRAPQAPQAPQAPLAPQAPKAPGTMYLIPGCYMGNVSPKEVALPAGCDIAKLTTISP
jgi:hypothetical protein